MINVYLHKSNVRYLIPLEKDLDYLVVYQEYVSFLYFLLIMEMNENGV